MSSPVDSMTSTTTLGTTADPGPLSPLVSSLLSTFVTKDTSPTPSSLVVPAPPLSSILGDGPDGPTLVSTDGNGPIDTTTVYSTQNPTPTSTSTSDPLPASTHQSGQSAPKFGAIIAGVAGGVGFLLLLVGVTWVVWVRRAKRRSLIKDRRFYPDRYNQTITNHWHSKFNEIAPGPVTTQPPPLPRRQTSRSPPGPPSRRTSSYHNHIPSSWSTRGIWAGASPIDGTSGSDVPPLSRHRFPYPSSPQPLADRYTMLPEPMPTSSVNFPTAPLRVLSIPPLNHPQHFRSSSSTHHSHHNHHTRPHRQRSRAEHDSYFPPIPIPDPIPMSMPITRRTAVIISPPISPSSSTSHPPTARSTFSSIDSVVVVNGITTRKRMMVTNPDLDIDLTSDTEPGVSSGGGSRGGVSPSVTDIIRLYDRDRDSGYPSS